MIIKYYIFIISGILSVITTIQIILFKKNKGLLNIHFCILLGLFAIRHFTSILHFNSVLKNTISDISNSIIILAAFPVLHLYCVKITNDTLKTKITFSKLYVGILVLFYLTFNIVLIVNNYYKENTIYQLIIDFIFTSCFCYLNIKFLQTHLWGRKMDFKLEMFAEKWSKVLMLLFLLFPLKYYLQIIYYLFEEPILLDNKYQPTTSIVCILICIYILLNPNKFYKLDIHIKEENKKIIEEKFKLVWKTNLNLEIVNKSDQDVYDRISKNIKYYIGKINNVDFENHILLKPESKLNDLSVKLQIPKSHLVFLFKYYCKISFIDYKKKIRIEKAKKMIENNFLETNTLNSLATSVGFKSYDPFYRSFKEITSLGPTEYNIVRTKS